VITVAVWLWALLALCIAFLVYARFIEPMRLQVSRRDVHLPGLPAELDGTVIAHLSDLHCRPEPRALRIARRAIDEVIAADADLLCVSGDLAHHSPFVELTGEVVAPLAGIANRLAAVLGNHDHDRTLEAYAFGLTGPHLPLRQVIASLGKAGIPILHNESRTVAVRGRPVAVIGLGDTSCGYDDLEAALKAAPQGDLRVVVTHSPDAMDLPGIEWADLVLCGHTHGGQLTLPGIGSPWAPVWRDRRRSEGLFEVAGTLCHVSRGVGAGTNARFRCRPEITLLTLRRSIGVVRRLPQQGGAKESRP
jgi:predicted MPP superfamily phosphohydrolase